MSSILRFLLICNFFWLGAMTANAEYINGLKTWITDEPYSVGIFHYDAFQDSWGWTRNGLVFRCNQTGTSPTVNRVDLYCPQIETGLALTRNSVLMEGPDGTYTYSGKWDDRRFWYYQADGFVGRFFMKDNHEWVEQQWRNDVLVATYTFRETNRNDNLVYLVDFSRDVSVALGYEQSYLRIGAEPWRELYRGGW
jgi:hypothetical protein